MTQNLTDVTAKTQADKAAKDSYVPPRIITYSSDEILEQVGPALTCSSPF